MRQDAELLTIDGGSERSRKQCEREYGYDRANQLLTITDPLQRVTTYDYDLVGRITQVTSPDPMTGVAGANSPTMHYTYDAVGNVLQVSDAEVRTLGYLTRYSYDQLFRRTAETDGNGDVTTFEYDLADNLTKLTDPKGNPTSWTYDDLDRVHIETDVFNNPRTYLYDAVGNERKMTDRRGLVTEYQYDNLYRLTGETWKDASDNQVRQLDFSYDLLDNLLTAADPSASYTYAYDDLDRPTTETQNLTALPDDVEFTHGYDLVHNHTSVAAKTGPTLDFLSEYTLDNLYRVTSVTQRGQGGRDVAAKHVAFTYDIASQMTDISRYSDFEVDPQELVAASHIGYDQVGRLTSIVHASTELPPATTWDGDLTTAPTSTPSDTISAYRLVYDKANRLATFESFADQFWADYDYDDRNQLTVADYSGPGSLPDDETYVFDANGNRDSVTIGSTTDDFVPGQDNRLASNGAFRFQYDEEGNRVARYIDDGDGEFGPNDTDITEYTWDHRNRLTRITERDNYAAAVDKVIEYNYDLFDRRTSKTVDPDGSTGSQQPYRDIFVYTGEHIAFEFHNADADGTSSVPVVSHRYLHGPGIDMILADEQIASGSGPGEVYWALADHLGSTRDVIHSTGTIVGHFVYDTFGQIVSETNPAFDFRFTFTGRERDAETPGLMYYRARYYSTIEGVFISKDPIGFNAGDANLYRYVGNQVTTHTDPSGLIDPDVWLEGEKPRPRRVAPLPKPSRSVGTLSVVPVDIEESYLYPGWKGYIGPIFLSRAFCRVKLERMLQPSNPPQMVDQIKDMLGPKGKVDMLIIRAHGGPGYFMAGSEMKPPGRLPPYSTHSIQLANIDPKSKHYDAALVAKLRELRAHFKPDSKVRLWTCEPFKGDDGERFMQLLAITLGVRVQGLDVETGDAILYFWEPHWFEAEPYASDHVKAGE